MLSIGKLTGGAGAYYTSMVADSAEEYYTGDREVPGVWVGRGSEHLGLSDTVQPDAFASVLSHQFPGTNVRITVARSAPTVVGFDATFCAPKSVSVLYSLGTTVVRDAIRDAHDTAVTAALAVFEDEASRGRRGRGGAQVVEGDGFVGAAFRHRTSRAGDPHLHTHVVIANLVHGPDGRWTALDARPLYHWAKTVGYLYEAELRHQLTATLGVEWRTVRRGIADLAVVPMQVIDEFSTRRHEIEAYLEATGFDSARAAQVATYATRRMKDHTATPETLLDGWRRRATDLGFDAVEVRPALSAPSSSPALGHRLDHDDVDRDVLFAELAGPHGLTANRATFGRRDVLMGICERLPNGAPIGKIVEMAEQFIDSDHCLHLTGENLSFIHTRAGTSVSARTDETRFSTPDMIQTERRLVAAAIRQVDGPLGCVPIEIIEHALRSRPSMSDEQMLMVWKICGAGRPVDVIEGVAGAGKTFALAAAHQAWNQAGMRVVGCSLAAKAARQLQTDAQIPSQTIDRLLIDLDQPEHRGLAPNTVIVVDEAAMVGTRKLLRLFEHAADADAKVVLVGDPCQLPEIEAGGGFIELRDRLDAAHLVQNRRQNRPWERVALAQLRAGHTDNAIDTYQEHGRVITTPNGADARHLMVDDWAEARTSQAAVMLASRRVDVDTLNRIARTRLQRDGVIGNDQITIGGRGFVEGDLVLATRNDRHLNVLNGTRAVIEHIGTTTHTMRCRTEDHQALTIPFAYVENGHLDHAYAMTVHKAQGSTFDCCLVLAGDQLTKETIYTAMSRGRVDNTLYVVSDHPSDHDAHTSKYEQPALDTIRNSIRRTDAQTMATQHTPPPEPDTSNDHGIDL